MLTENRVHAAVTDRLPVEVGEVILSWAMMMEGNLTTTRGSKAKGGFRVAARRCEEKVAFHRGYGN